MLPRVYLTYIFGLLLVVSGHAEVRVFLQSSNNLVWVRYECTAGELVRAFALDVSVDQGQITGVSNFFRGQSTASGTGYGIFPASLRDQLRASGSTNIDWQAGDYTPLASTNDNLEDTLPGLGSPGVTLEFGGLWDPSVLAAIPGASGTLCSLSLSQPANVFVTANLSRGGVISAFEESIIDPVFEGIVLEPTITSAALQNGTMVILFEGGELESAPSVEGPWTGTGEFSGSYVEPVGTNRMKFYRVRAP